MCVMYMGSFMKLLNVGYVNISRNVKCYNVVFSSVSFHFHVSRILTIVKWLEMAVTSKYFSQSMNNISSIVFIYFEFIVKLL